MRLQVTEYAGVALIAVALGFVHYALAIGAVGIYLFVSSVVAQVIGGADGREETKD